MLDVCSFALFGRGALGSFVENSLETPFRMIGLFIAPIVMLILLAWLNRLDKTLRELRLMLQRYSEQLTEVSNRTRSERLDAGHSSSSTAAGGGQVAGIVDLIEEARRQLLRAEAAGKNNDGEGPARASLDQECSRAEVKQSDILPDRSGDRIGLRIIYGKLWLLATGILEQAETRKRLRDIYLTDKDIVIDAVKLIAIGNKLDTNSDVRENMPNTTSVVIERLDSALVDKCENISGTND